MSDSPGQPGPHETPTSRAFRDAAKRMRSTAQEFRQLHADGYEKAKDLEGAPALAAFDDRREWLRIAARCEKKAVSLDQMAGDLEGVVS